MDARIRELALPDLPQLVRLCREHAAYERAAWIPDDSGREEGLQGLFLAGSSAAERGAQAWVVEAGERLVGFATTSLERSTWDARRFLHLDCLYLQEPWRNRGLGRALMARAAQLAADFDRVALGADRVEVVAGAAAEGFVTYVQRSFLFAFPDYITVRFLEVDDQRSTIALLSRARYGKSDLGVNEKRITNWLAQLD